MSCIFATAHSGFVFEASYFLGPYNFIRKSSVWAQLKRLNHQSARYFTPTIALQLQPVSAGSRIVSIFSSSSVSSFISAHSA